MNCFLPLPVRRAFLQAVSGTCRTSLWLLKIMIPVSLAVSLLQYFGVIQWMAGYTASLFHLFGLPGEAAVTFLTGALVGTYGGIAAMMGLALTLRQATILSLMICLCHALPMESAVVRKTGSSFWLMTGLRLAMALLCAFCLNQLLPQMQADFGMAFPQTEGTNTLSAMLTAWAVQMGKLALMVVGIVYFLMVIQRVLEAYDGIRRLSQWLRPLMRLFGIPEGSAYLWLVGNVLGISYGCAVMLELEEQGMLTPAEANEANYHLVMNHSLVEDTLVFGAIGIPVVCIIGTRLLFALAVVWTRRGLRAVWARIHA